jgi:hypothetical protein
MEEWQILREQVLMEKWDQVESKAKKLVNEVLKEKQTGETIAWALQKVRDHDLKELQDFFKEDALKPAGFHK